MPRRVLVAAGDGAELVGLRSAVSRRGNVHPAISGLLLVDAGVADTVFTAKVGNRKARLVLFQDRDNLFFGKSATLHALVLKLGQNELQTGLNLGGKVTCDKPARPLDATPRPFNRSFHWQPGH